MRFGWVVRCHLFEYGRGFVSEIRFRAMLLEGRLSAPEALSAMQLRNS